MTYTDLYFIKGIEYGLIEIDVRSIGGSRSTISFEATISLKDIGKFMELYGGQIPDLPHYHYSFVPLYYHKDNVKIRWNAHIQNTSAFIFDLMDVGYVAVQRPEKFETIEPDIHDPFELFTR